MPVLSVRPFVAACFLAAFAHSPSALGLGRYDARDGDECRAQVKANFDAIERELAAAGNYRGIWSMNERGRYPALEECEQMDRQAREEHMRAAHDRLSDAIATLQAGGVIHDEQKRSLRQDHSAIFAFPDSPYRRECLRLFDAFARYVEQPAPTPTDCDRIRHALADARREHDASVDALIRRDPAWRVHDERRKAAILETQWQESRARRAGCR